MNQKMRFEKTENGFEQIKVLFNEFSAPGVYHTWADTFEIAGVEGKKVQIAYKGKNFRKFKKACGQTLSNCVQLYMGSDMKVKFFREKMQGPVNTDAKKNFKAARLFLLGMIFVCFAAAAILVLGNYIGNRDFRETYYITSSIKVDRPVRVLQLSDMHGVEYGKNNEALLERIEALNPDLILCTGDIVDSAEEEADYAVSLAEKLVKIAPSYYVYGNNEVETIFDFGMNEKDLDKKFGFDDTNRDETALLALPDAFEAQLESVGMKVLKNETDTIRVGTTDVDVYGVLNSNPSSFWSYSGKAFSDYIYENTDHLKITAVHEPFIFETYEPESWGDLMICGHTHGGLMRVPMVGPLYTHEGGLFPERNNCFVYGRYNVAGGTLIVSGGLENTNVLRVNNEPELVIIDINTF